MTARSHLRGHPIYWDGKQFRFSDTNNPTVETHNERPCRYCGLAATPEGHDGCLGELPGVTNACCGHGKDRKACIQYPDGSTIRGERALSEFARLGAGPASVDEQQAALFRKHNGATD